MSLKKIIEQWKGQELKQVLKELYIEKDMSMHEVAEELSVSVGAVHAWLHKYGISKQTSLWDV